jgi:hypothetical protein
MDDLTRLAELIKTRNRVTANIAAVVGRPALVGHVGEHIASRVFRIALEESASRKAVDGHFTDNPLTGRSVNIKWYAKQEGLLDITPDALPDYYLVLAGPKSAAISSRGIARPWLIASVHLFDAHELVNGLRRRGLKIGVAASVRQQLWREAEIYPTRRSARLVLSAGQRELLAIFG